MLHIYSLNIIGYRKAFTLYNGLACCFDILTRVGANETNAMTDLLVDWVIYSFSL